MNKITLKSEKLSIKENELANNVFNNLLGQSLSNKEKEDLEKLIYLFYKLASQRAISPDQLELDL